MIEARTDGLGSQRNAPINGVGQLSTAQGFDPIYSGVPLTNYLGKTENPQATYADDLGALKKALPALDTDGAWLANPDDNGLMRLKLRGQDMQFFPGQSVVLPVNVTRRDWANGGTEQVVQTQRVQVPRDPQEAAKFLASKLPPGWFPVQNGYQPLGAPQAFTLNYGFRLKGTEEAAAAADAQAMWKRAEFNATSATQNSLKKGYTGAGGAAFGAYNYPRGAHPGPTDPMTQLGSWLSENVGPAPTRGIGGFN